MIILAIRTDKPEAELYVYKDTKQLCKSKWLAHLKLAETLNYKIEEILNKLSISYYNLNGIVVFKGPGSFTGLRIGMSVANALSYSLQIAIVSAGGDDWLNQGVGELLASGNEKIAIPDYGMPAHVTRPKK